MEIVSLGKRKESDVRESDVLQAKAGALYVLKKELDKKVCAINEFL